MDNRKLLETLQFALDVVNNSQLGSVVNNSRQVLDESLEECILELENECKPKENPVNSREKEAFDAGYDYGIDRMEITFEEWRGSDSANKSELPVEISFENCGDGLIVRCPNEESEMAVVITHSRNNFYSLCLDEAEELKDFLANHIKNERLCNPEVKNEG